MFDLLWPGDEAIFKRTDDPPIGTIVIFRLLRNNTVTVKQLKHNGHDYYLHPLNAKYPDMPFEKMQKLGYLIGIIRKIGEEKVTRFNPNGIRP